MTGAPPPPAGPRWHVVVPVKDAARAKTRLRAPQPVARTTLARAVAVDTLEQVCRAVDPEQVTVVTSDAGASELARRLGARVVADPGRGLNAAVAAGFVGWPTGPTPGRTGWAVLLGDLPSLRAPDLADALARCAAYPCAVVPDAEGTGTVLLTSTTGVPEPRFGPGSAQRHAETGVRLDLDAPRLRRDVDTAEDLAAAVALGVGPRTAAALGLRAGG